MYLRELTQEAVVDDAVIFHDTLNPALWSNNKLKPQIRLKLLEIARNFIDFISIPGINIKIKGIDVEVYVQGSEDAHHSAGIYSVLDDQWVSEPKQERVDINDDDVENKVNSYVYKIRQILKSDDKSKIAAVKDEIAKIRKAGLETAGEFSVENLTFKVLRAKGLIDKLRDRIRELEDQELSLRSL